MSRRASLLAKQNKCKPKVRFPDELVFLDNIKENDLPAVSSMLRRASVQVDINGLNDAGLTPLHQAVLDGNYGAVKLLISHGANVSKRDADFWTPLHAACAEGHADIARYLLKKGADSKALTEEGERPIDLCDPADVDVISVMLRSQAATETSIEDSGDELDERDVSGDIDDIENGNT
ncbi:protein phosphatase 1 regulatory subunit 27-like [Gigantopelta aegis]|uniref:protein phosphatase 1 regulatory subunit 27-like n=1 Tax=Gigantopelta aegis TaxID=1735272 RepID=UPI001B887944|nr:protein phosphatase 1 regulatory subunit 27-like [Gigantopelta aegis]